MLSIKQIVTGSVILSIFILPSCIDDSLDNQCPADEVVDVRMTITLPEPIVKSISTKAYSTRTDYNTVNDINVLVFNSSGTALIGSYYFDATYTGVSPLPTISPSLPLNSGNLQTTITFNDVEPTSKFYLVGNFGSKITSTVSITSLNDLKNLKQNASNGIPLTCMMYAEATPTVVGSTTYMDAKLIRTLSMVTVKVDGTNLSVSTGKEIRIIPKRIRLRNVPTSCVLGNDIPNVGGSNATNVLAGDSAIIAWGTLSSATPTTLGGHETSAIPLFQFENRQGSKSPTADQIYKTTLDKPNSSYLEVEATYQYFENGVINKLGTIIYKFCLGSDITANFDVMRNTHYAVTLELSGWGGALEDGQIVGGVLLINGPTPEVGWRVDLALKNFGFLQDEYNVDAHASFGYVQVLGGGNKVAFAPGYGSTDWIKFLKSNKTDWALPAANAPYHEITIGLNQYYIYYILPWQYVPSGDPNEIPYRETKLLVYPNNVNNSQTVTIRQWAPISLGDGLYMERFEEAGNSLAWGYNGDLLTGTYSGFTFAFGGTEVNGWNNTLYLYKRDSVASRSAQLCMKKAGYDLNGVFGDPPLLASQRAAYFMPSVNELGKVIGYVGDLSEPYQFHDPVKTAMDYWSSSVPNADHTSTYYWQGVPTPPVAPVTINTTTTTRNTARWVRCVYRPTLNTNATGLPANPRGPVPSP